MASAYRTTRDDKRGYLSLALIERRETISGRASDSATTIRAVRRGSFCIFLRFSKSISVPCWRTAVRRMRNFTKANSVPCAPGWKEPLRFLVCVFCKIVYAFDTFLTLATRFFHSPLEFFAGPTAEMSAFSPYCKPLTAYGARRQTWAGRGSSCITLQHG